MSASEIFRECPDSIPAGADIPVSRCSSAALVAPDWIVAYSAEVAAAVHGHPDADALHAAGLIDLAWPSGTSLDRSISLLKGAARLGEDADLLADLSAAYLARAEREQAFWDVVEAVEVASRAVKLSDTNRAARFNLALALERLGLAEQSEVEWGRYLELDSTSRWGKEAARRRADAVGRHPPLPVLTAATQSDEAASFAMRDPEAARWAGWDRLLGEWGDAVTSADTATAREMFRLARTIGDALERRGGDGTLAEAVRAVDATAGSRTAYLQLARAHAEFARARVDYAAQSYQTAAARLRVVIAQSGRSKALRQWATLFLGASLVYLHRPADGRTLIEQVAHSADTAHEGALAGRANWSLGITYLRAGGYAGAMSALQRANGLFERIGERESQGAVDAIQAEGLFDIGDANRGAVALHRALTLLRPFRSSVWLHNAVWLGGREATRSGYVNAASRFEAEDIVVARDSKLPAQVVEAHLARARVFMAAGARDSADAALQAARQSIPSVPPDLEPWLNADLRLSEAERVVAVDPARAVAKLDSVVTYFGSDARHPVRLIPALLARARALLALRATEAATRDLARAVQVIDARQDSIVDLPERAQLLDAARGVFDRVVMLHVSSGRARQALEFFEHGRTVLRRVSASRARDAASSRLGPSSQAVDSSGHVLVDYALIGDTLLTWVIGPTGVRLTRTTIERRTLREQIDRARTTLELGSSQASAAPDLAALYDLLIRPIRRQLDTIVSLVVIPDRELADVPFPALLDRETGTFLVERTVVRVATSLVDARRLPSAGDGWSAVFVVDPAFDAQTFRGLRRLPGAVREVAAVAPLYRQTTTLGGSAATPRALATAMANANVVHYAGHSLFDDDRPERSVLVLANDSTGDAGERGLPAERIARLRLDRVRLVVLSACESVRTHRAGSNGFSGLAGAFLTAGADGVVGSLWRVDDATTADFMVAFHRAFRASGDASAALRAAQVDFLRSTDAARRSPAVWAAFRYVGT